MNVLTPPDALASPARVSARRPALDQLPVAVIGAGPVGLAAAAHLLARGLEPVILEAGSTPAAAVRAWGHVPMFSPWAFNVDRAARDLLKIHGWTPPDPEAYPTGHELADAYLDPLSRTPEIAGRRRHGVRVTAVARAGTGKVRTAGRELQPFEVRFTDRTGREGRLFARAVIDASGTWSSPNPAGASGLPALGEAAAARTGRLRYGMPDVLGAQRGDYAGRRVLVVGSGHSAAGTLIDLAQLQATAPGTRVTWALRTRAHLARVYGGGDKDQLAARGALGTRLRQLVEGGAFGIVAPFTVDTIEQDADGTLRISGEAGDAERALEADAVIVATGLKPDLGLLAELRTDLDPALDCPRALAPLIDPNVHSCGTVRPHGAHELAQPEPGLFLIGMKSYGRAPTFLLATGHEQARSVAAYLAGDEEAARRVELELPETGVCSGPALAAAAPAAACCGGPAPDGVEACCADDTAAKAAGEAGCGCGAQPAPEPPATAGSCCGPGAPELARARPAATGRCGA